MEIGIEWLIGLALVWGAFACLGAYISAEKGRDGGEGLILGLLFGPLGLLIAALLPNQPEQLAALREVEAARLAQEAKREADRRHRAREMRRRFVAATGSLAARGLTSATVIGRWLVGFRWFRAWPDWLQAVAIGAVIAVPVIIFLVRMLG